MNTFRSAQNSTDKQQTMSGASHTGLVLQKKSGGLHSPALISQNEKRLQAKLSIGANNDPLEQEADRIADQVMESPANPVKGGTIPSIQRFAGQSAGQAGTAPASVDHVLSGSGRPLDLALQQDMGQRFGHDFSRVRVHTGAAAEQSARDINALAYTAGQNIVFGAGRYAPGSQEGQHLLAHELTHVVQQSSNIATIQRLPDPECGNTTPLPMSGSCSSYVHTCNSETFVPASSAKIHISVDVEYAEPPGNTGPEDFSVQVYKCGLIWDTKIGSKRLGPNIPSNLSFDIASVTPGDKYYLKIYSRSHLRLRADYSVTQ